MKNAMRNTGAGGTLRQILVHHRSLSTVPRRVTIHEVGARDGLQNEPMLLSAEARTEFVRALALTGLPRVEAASFVHPKLVPQMADAADVLRGSATYAAGASQGDVSFPVLVPNRKGFDDAVAAGARSVALMTAASETFSARNVNSTILEQVERAVVLTAEAEVRQLTSRTYISCALGCPFEGAISPHAVAKIAHELHAAGCREVVLSDTIGTGTPGSMATLLKAVLPLVPAEHLAVHCHDTYGQALANIYVALEHGVTVIDSSVAGLGGCPFAGDGAAGNVATEDVVYMLEGLGIETSVDLYKVAEVGEEISRLLERPNSSKAGLAMLRAKRSASSAAGTPADAKGESFQRLSPQSKSPLTRPPIGHPGCHTVHQPVGASGLDAGVSNAHLIATAAARSAGWRAEECGV